MAFSTSLFESQKKSVCQFCEESSDIKWKCINCDLFLCQLCHSRIHSKSKSSTDHTVIKLRDYRREIAKTETTRKVDLTRMTCEQHSDEKCLLHCKTCDKPVCSDCLVGDHQNHQYGRLDIVYERKLQVIRDVKCKIESEIHLFKKQGSNLQHILSEENKQFAENKDKIIEFRDKIIRHADNLIINLDLLRKPREYRIKKELDSVRQRKITLEKRKTQLDRTLGSSSAAYILGTSTALDKTMSYNIGTNVGQRKYELGKWRTPLDLSRGSSSVSDIFGTGSLIDKTMSDKTVSQAELKHRTFTPGTLLNQSLSDIFGYVVPNIEIANTYHTEFNRTIKFIKCNYNFAFMGNSFGDVLQKVTLKRDRIQCIKSKITFSIFDMAMMNNRDLLISSRKTNLQLYTTDNQSTAFGMVSPLYTLGVHVNKQNEIFLGLSESDRNTFSKDTVRRVVLMDHNGDIKQCFEYDRYNQRLFTWPRRICTNDKYIFVVDILHDGTGREVNEFSSTCILLGSTEY
ncbi:E3 ubiquitin-protein ligase TRIM45-like [Mytilus trossulus]|uniref:E3 ubiquitin-protein ligase TRIM45-like n=1 Tax=Mytilus trossulus TaxID=6551 RepID=UPI0030044922